MRIISYLNTSNLSNLEADSGYVFQKTLLNELAILGHEVYLIGPPKMSGLPSSITPIFLNFPDNKYGVRLGLEWEKLIKELSKIEPCDVILNNQSELTIALKTACFEAWNKKIPLAIYFHYISIEKRQTGQILFDPSHNLFGLSQLFWNRQLESAEYSDANIIGSNYGKKLFHKAFKAESKYSKFTIIPPPVQRFNKFKKENKLKNKKQLTLLYNHRLYDHYGGVEIFKLLQELHKEIPFKLIITDPTGKRSLVRERFDKSVCTIRDFAENLNFTEIKHFDTQETYYKAIRNIDIGIGHLRPGALWSMAIADIMSLGKPVIGYK
ncbi:MAG TPA: hypothetical protein VFJ43_04805, partial [Bacteroidia bacterium]|nr:hypothetical protein [Bacteroidia bacterium]